MESEISSRTQRKNRRQFIKAAGVTVSLASFAGCSGDGGGDGGGGDGGDGGDSSANDGGASTSSGDDEAVRIGLLAPLSGSTALTGQEIQRGVNMAIEHLDESIAGRDVEVVTRDTETTPDGALEGAQALDQEEDVHAIIGPSISSAGNSVIPYIRDQAQIPIFPTQVSDNSAREGENCTEYSYFIWPSNRHTVNVGVEFIYDLPDLIDRDFDPNQMHFFSPDYALGQNNLELLEEEVGSRGGEVTGSTMVPLGEQDLSSYISEVSNSDADVVTGVMTPDLAASFINQADEFGLVEDKVLMFNSGKPVDQITQASVGAAADGWYGTYFYDPESDSEINQSFHDLYPSDSDLLPNASCGSGFEPVRALAQAIEQAGSTESGDLVNELGGLSWDSIFGPAQFRAADGQIELDFAGATRQDTEFTVLEEYPDIIPENMC